MNTDRHGPASRSGYGPQKNADPSPAPELVLLPGLDGTGILFRPLIDSLPKDLKVRVISYPTDRRLGYEGLHRLIDDALSVGNPRVVLGESFSGPLALKIARSRPDDVRGVILCGTFVRNPIRWLPRWSRFLARPFLFRRHPTWIRDRRILGRFATPELSRMVTEANANVEAAVVAQRARAVLMVDARDDLAACQAPILCLSGSEDRLVRHQNLEEIMTLRPDVRSAVLKAPHLILQVAPTAAATNIVAFVREVGRLQ